MTNIDERLTALEAEVAELKLGLEAERRERAALPGILVPATAEAQRGLSMLEENFELTMQSMDWRVSELAKRGQGDGLLAELTGDIALLYKATLFLMKQHNALREHVDLLEESRTRQVEHLTRLLDVIAGPQAA